MQPTRRQKIEALLRDSPDDVFLRYSLALEMENDGDWEAATVYTADEVPHG